MSKEHTIFDYLIKIYKYILQEYIYQCKVKNKLYGSGQWIYIWWRGL